MRRLAALALLTLARRGVRRAAAASAADPEPAASR